jgi:hypothetical protein
MESNFNRIITYNEQPTEINVQILSNEFPKIIYVVKLKTLQPVKQFESIEQFNFHIDSEVVGINELEIRHYVVYDYKIPGNQIKDVNFEFAVWNSLLFKRM